MKTNPKPRHIHTKHIFVFICHFGFASNLPPLHYLQKTLLVELMDESLQVLHGVTIAQSLVLLVLVLEKGLAALVIQSAAMGGLTGTLVPVPLLTSLLKAKFSRNALIPVVIGRQGSQKVLKQRVFHIHFLYVGNLETLGWKKIYEIGGWKVVVEEARW